MEGRFLNIPEFHVMLAVLDVIRPMNWPRYLEQEFAMDVA